MTPNHCLKWLSSWLLVCLLSLWSPAYCLARGYLVSGEELARLETSLARQEQALLAALIMRETQEKELAGLKAGLEAALAELRQSKEEIQLLKASLESASGSIASANRLLREYESEMKGRLNRAKWQRNVWAALAVGLPVALMWRR